MSPITLTSEQLNHYRENGYLLLRAHEHNLVSPNNLNAWEREVHQWPRVKGKWMPYDEINQNGERQLMRTENFVDYHEGWKGLVCGKNLIGILEQLSDQEMLLFKDKINYKLPFGNGFQAHLDAPAYDHIGRIEHITANIAIDAATPENGCLEVVAGSHKMDVEFSHGGHISEAWERAQPWVSVPLERGDMLIFGSHLAHRSARNLTSAKRASLYATYHMRSDGEDLRAKYYAHRRANFPPDHEREPGQNYEEGFKTYGFAAPFSKPNAAANSTSIPAS
ncbi:phytanoyl-CoA dioxygenase family protein [Aspergillus candidus]|uniref:PhyH-domain-containing protein n=1 Tax=Aspergillus candidus TaxID=41067 RepID=A0A2I2FBH7_ASPCN|nr:hypothetical protein BDW47DRAFT_30470 [Aspergillus candidus]PLB37985.1 hypothetical protein BDW47DRAFT_30470 [Aspergillus candidus]